LKEGSFPGGLHELDTQPRSEVPALVEGGAVANGSNDGSGDNWSDPRDLTYPRASGIRGRDPFQFQVEFFYLLFNELPLSPGSVANQQVPYCRLFADCRQSGHNPDF
jgi:hypothetical protein